MSALPETYWQYTIDGELVEFSIRTGQVIDKPVCGLRVDPKPYWMGDAQYEYSTPCLCPRPKGHSGGCTCDHIPIVGDNGVK
jgi:hypothetical protein